MATHDEKDSYFKVNIASDYVVTCVVRSSFAGTVTYLFFFFIASFELIHTSKQSEKV